MSVITHKKPVSLTLNTSTLSFLNNFSRQKGYSRSALAEKIFKIFEKQVISHYFQADAMSDSQEDLNFVNIDNNSFINLLKDEENHTI